MSYASTSMKYLKRYVNLLKIRSSAIPLVELRGNYDARRGLKFLAMDYNAGPRKVHDRF